MAPVDPIPDEELTQLLAEEEKTHSAEVQIKIGDWYGNFMNGAKQAREWWEKAAEHYDGFLCIPAGDVVYCYEKGIGCEQNLCEAITWYEKPDKWGAVPSRNLTAISRCYAYNTGLGDDDLRTAFDYFTKAAAEKNTEGTILLGDCYLHGRGVAQDKAEAMRCYQKAIDDAWHNGADKCRAYVALGRCYEHGDGVEKDEKKRRSTCIRKQRA